MGFKRKRLFLDLDLSLLSANKNIGYAILLELFFDC